MWKPMLSAHESDQYRAARPRVRRPGGRRWGPPLVVRRVRVLLLGTSENEGVSGPWHAHAMWQVCGITRLPSGTAQGGERPVQR
ncbi:MAG TPA: hypothetical protein VFU85_11465 [Nocardioides sp.]|nr:hypothetical protein [Nocardioides sp.]